MLHNPSSAAVRLIAHASLAAFAAYFCAYGLRKPFDALTLGGAKYPIGGLDLKTACALGQVFGYLISKFVGARVCSETPRARRAVVLVGAAAWAETALVGFAVLPDGVRPLALFANGLPLGVMWGLVVRYLEGRRTSEILLIGLSAAFLLAGAVTKDVGLWLLRGGVPEAWMPAAAGAVFFGPFVAAVLALDRLPPPTETDTVARSVRADLDAAGRRAFLRRIGPGFVPVLAAYLLLTSYRDFRDFFGRELFAAVGEPGTPGMFTRADAGAAVGALAALTVLAGVRNHRTALGLIAGFVACGFAGIGVATAAYRAGWVSGTDWLAMVGAGLYLAHVPFGVALFERLVAAARFPGTSVFAVQLADGIGGTGSAAVLVARDLAHPGGDRLGFFVGLSFAVSGLGLGLTAAAVAGLWRVSRPPASCSGRSAGPGAGV